ncbi:MAG: carbohydrate kinase [Bacteroidales bacterium]
MKKRNIVAIGETLLDIIFREHIPVAAKPGGSTLNTSVSLGRLGLPVEFISEWGEDEVGEMIEKFLNENGVGTGASNKYPGVKTTLALAFLDENNNASYSFYKQYPANRLVKQFPSFASNDFFLFGSFFALSREIRQRLLELLNSAKQAGAIILYDPNFRKAHLHELNELKPVLEENFRFANLVKGSDEDFECIFGARNVNETYDAIRKESMVLVYTAGAKQVHVKTPKFELSYTVPSIIPVSTIGAGDTFTAGLVYGLYQAGVTNEQLPAVERETWDIIILQAITFAREVCMSLDNYLPGDFIKDFLSTK